MNEPPPPYSVYYFGIHREWIIKYPTACGRYGIHSPYKNEESALIARDRLNAAYMQGWRDRDEADDATE